MKKIFFFVTILQLSFSVFGQYYASPNTFYVIPPVNGCDGVWAVNDSLITSGNCPPPYMLTVFPNGCATENHVSVDTLFFDLCSIPCSYKLVNFNGDTCLSCFVGASIDTITLQCDITDSIYNSYIEDAKRLALRHLINQNSSYKDSIEIPNDLSNTFVNALNAVYNATTLPARDTVISIFNIHTFPDPVTKGISLSADSNLTWMINLRDNIFPTGDNTIDSLISRYYLHKTYYSYWSNSFPFHTVRLESDSSYNMSILANSFDNIQGVYYSEVTDNGGDGSDITGMIYSNYVELKFILKWGDCESGCIYSRYWTFHVFEDCSVAFMGSYGNSVLVDYNSEINTINNFSIYPNPNNGEFTISVNKNQNSTIAIYNSMGIKVKTEHFKANSSELKITGLTAGVYFVVVEEDGKRIGGKKVVVE